MTQFKKLCAASTPVKHMISVLYKLLTTDSSPIILVSVREWEHDLQCDFSDSQWSTLYCLTLLRSIESKAQENNYKFSTRWYCVSTK